MNLDRTFSIVILILIIIGIIGVVYIIYTPNESVKFTELYLLGGSGKAGDYPTNLTTGEEGNITIGIVNHELTTTSYQLRIISNNKTLKTENLTLDNNETKEIPFQFIAGSSGSNKIEFNLYKLPDTVNIYRSVFIQ